jgi:SAM-dependent methyltransferase
VASPSSASRSARKLVEIGRRDTEAQGLEAEFVQADLRQLDYDAEFDVVVNLNDGAVGYLETDEQNRRTFAAISRCLKPGGRNLVQLPPTSSTPASTSRAALLDPGRKLG